MDNMNIYIYVGLNSVTFFESTRKRNNITQKIIRMHTCKYIIYLDQVCDHLRCQNKHLKTLSLLSRLEIRCSSGPQTQVLQTCLDSGQEVRSQKGNAIWLTFTYTCLMVCLRAFRASFPKSPSIPGERRSAVSILRVGAVELGVLSVMLRRLIVTSHRGEPGKIRATVLSAIIRQPLQSSARFPIP